MKLSATSIAVLRPPVPVLSAKRWIRASAASRQGILSSPYDGEIFKVAVPALCAGLLSPLTTAVDTGVVGRLGTVPLSGVAVGSVIFLFLSNLFVFVQFLITPAVARAEAKRETEKLGQIIGAAIRLGTVVGLLVGTLVYFSTSSIVAKLAPPVEVRSYAVVYLRIMATSIPPFVLYQSLAGILRGMKSTITIFIASGIATVANIILDIVFVFGFGWGVAGAAWATSLTTYVSTFIMLNTVLRSGKVEIRHLTDFSATGSGNPGKVIGDSLVLLIRTTAILTMVLCSSAVIAKQGPITHSAYEVCRIVFLTTHATYTAFDFTMQALCASYLGEEKRQSAREVLERTLQIVLCVVSVVGVLLIAFSENFIRLFTNSAEVISEFRSAVWPLMGMLPVGGLAAVIDGALLGASRFRLVAGYQTVIAALAVGMMILCQRQGVLSLALTAVIVRFGLSSQILFSWWFAFFREYSLKRAKQSPQT